MTTNIHVTKDALYDERHPKFTKYCTFQSDVHFEMMHVTKQKNISKITTFQNDGGKVT
jgi:hypothetical protein